jgi:hypothetical protein
MTFHEVDGHGEDLAVAGWRLSLAAAAAIVVLWGGILVIAQIEQALPADLRWWGHAFVHLWTAASATVILVVAVRLLRSGRVTARALRTAIATSSVLAAIATVAGTLEVVGAYPAFRPFHDAVNTVAAPVGWLLLANLVAIVLIGAIPSRVSDETGSGSEDDGSVTSDP